MTTKTTKAGKNIGEKLEELKEVLENKELDFETKKKQMLVISLVLTKMLKKTKSGFALFCDEKVSEGETHKEAVSEWKTLDDVEKKVYLIRAKKLKNPNFDENRKFTSSYINYTKWFWTNRRAELDQFDKNSKKTQYIAEQWRLCSAEKKESYKNDLPEKKIIKEEKKSASKKVEKPKPPVNIEKKATQPRKKKASIKISEQEVEDVVEKQKEDFFEFTKTAEI